MSELYKSKIPEVTLAFWITKILATTVGETGGDALSMTLQLGYAVSSIIFATFFIVAFIMQVRAKSFHPMLYWLVIVTTTTVGTTMADFVDHSLGIGYVGGSLILFVMLAVTMALWRYAFGAVSIKNINSSEGEIFYWVTILYSNTLGTALGDFLADSGPGYEGGALIVLAMLAVVAACYFCTHISRTLLFWSAFILTRPLGAMIGDLLTKTPQQGGFDLSRINSSLVITLLMVASILLASRRAATHPA